MMKRPIAWQRVLVVLGTMVCASSVFAAPGDLDGTFGQHGVATFALPVPGTFIQRERMIRQSDGKIVIVGTAGPLVAGAFQARDFAIVRLNADGTPDNSFDNDGVTTIDFNGSTDRAYGLVQQAFDGKLIVVGYAGCTAPFCMAAVRLNVDGSLDTTFDIDGKVVLPATIAPGATPGFANNAVMQGTNIVIGGYTATASGDFVFVRLNSVGALDASFGTGGVSVVDMGPSILMWRMIAQADGKLIAVGGQNSNATPTTHVMGIARVNGTDGSKDLSFGTGGTIATNCMGYCQYNSVNQQADGKLVFSGITSESGPGSPELQPVDTFIERRNPDGTPDTTFGQAGRITKIFGNAYGRPLHSSEAVFDSVLDSSGNIIATGRAIVRTYGETGTAVLGGLDTFIARYLPSGEIDASFGTQGLRGYPSIIRQAGDSVTLAWGEIEQLPDGRLLMLGTGSRTDSDGMVVDLNIALARLSNGPSDPGVLAFGAQHPFQESSGAASVVVRRQGGVSGTVSVSYATVSGIATAGSDFVPQSGTLTWVEGDQSSKLIRVGIVADQVPEAAEETFQLTLSNPTGGADVAMDSTTIRIVPDNVPPANSITLSPVTTVVSEAAGSVSLTVARTGTGPIAVSYYTGSLLAATTAPTFAQPRNDMSDVAGVLVWGAGDTAPKTITVPLINDSILEQPESFNVRLLLPGGGAVLGADLATITINDDEPGPVVSIASTASVTESQGAVTLNVTRTGNSIGPVSINVSTGNGTAIAGSDYTSTSTTLTWQPTDADTKTVTVPISNDAIAESSKSFTLTLSGATGGATIGNATANITIVDDDTAPATPSGNSGGGGGGAFDALSFASLLVFLALVTLSRRSRIRTASLRRMKRDNRFGTA